MTDTTEALAHLHTRVVDACEGHEEGRDLAEKPDVRAVFERLLAMHRDHAAALAEALAARGVRPDDDGSFLQYVHKAVLNVRSALTGLGDNVIPGIRDGEERLLALYDETRAAAGGDAAIAGLLERQRTAVADQVGDLRRLERAAGA